jgi:lipid-A-disaccharide synthase
VTRSGGPFLVIVAGEPSGDVIGARLMAALKDQTDGAVRFTGVGGERMLAEGLIPLFPMADLSVMGISAVLERLPLLLRRLHQAVDATLRLRPDALVTIDSPGFSFRLARRVGGAGLARVHYVAPTVWAWRPGRAARIARFLDHLLLLFPFEKPYFDAVGLPATYVGHPVIEESIADADGAALRRRLGIPESAMLLTVLPGSRADEVRRHMPVFAETVVRLAAMAPALQVVLPTVGAVAGTVRESAATWPVPVRVVEGAADRHAAFAASRAALAASGSVTLELAAAGLPGVVAYRTSAVTAMIARRLVRIPWAGLVNILAEADVMPEFLQERCTPANLAEALAPLVHGGPARDAQMSAMGGVMARLRAVPEPPSRAAARAVLDVLAQRGVASALQPPQ